MTNSPLKHHVKALILVPLLILAACASQPPGTGIQPTKPTVLALPYDNHAAAIDRNSPIQTALGAGLKSGLTRQGYRILDQDFAAQQLDWDLNKLMSKTELIQAAKLMRQSGHASLRPDYLVTYQLLRNVRTKRFAKILSLRLSGQAYHIASNRFIGESEVSSVDISVPNNCDKNCLNNFISVEARQLARRLGFTLANKIGGSDPHLAGWVKPRNPPPKNGRFQ